MTIQRTVSRAPQRTELVDVNDDNWTPARVLLAEDDLQLRLLLRDMLRKKGYVVEEASSGFEMLEQLGMDGLRHKTFDLIVTCNQMRGATGLEVIDELRKCLDPHCWCTPVILITGFGDSQVYAEAIRLGAVVLDKPLDLDVFLQHAAALVSPTPS